nr:MAG TPA: hypothetical protein [Caudoviricetes sp.]DAR39141.1 MAG TPA: hypothetical protein [Caudoviricetes sp.]
MLGSFGVFISNYINVDSNCNSLSVRSNIPFRLFKNSLYKSVLETPLTNLFIL